MNADGRELGIRNDYSAPIPSPEPSSPKSPQRRRYEPKSRGEDASHGKRQRLPDSDRARQNASRDRTDRKYAASHELHRGIHSAQHFFRRDRLPKRQFVDQVSGKARSPKNCCTIRNIIGSGRGPCASGINA